MHWEKTIHIHLTLRSIVGAILAASTVVNLLIVGAAYKVDKSPPTPPITSELTTTVPSATITNTVATAGVTIASTLAQVSTPLPTNTPSSTPTDTAAPTETPTNLPVPTVCLKRSSWPVYRVRPGDGLFALAIAFGTNVKELMIANCLRDDRIYVGQLLYVPRLWSNPITSTSTPTDTQTCTPTDIPSAPLTDTPSPTPTHTLTDTPSPTLTDTPTPAPSATPTNSPTATPTYQIG